MMTRCFADKMWWVDKWTEIIRNHKSYYIYSTDWVSRNYGKNSSIQSIFREVSQYKLLIYFYYSYHTNQCFFLGWRYIFILFFIYFHVDPKIYFSVILFHDFCMWFQSNRIILKLHLKKKCVKKIAVLIFLIIIEQCTLLIQYYKAIMPLH